MSTTKNVKNDNSNADEMPPTTALDTLSSVGILNDGIQHLSVVSGGPSIRAKTPDPPTMMGGSGRCSVVDGDSPVARSHTSPSHTTGSHSATQSPLVSTPARRSPKESSSPSNTLPRSTMVSELTPVIRNTSEDAYLSYRSNELTGCHSFIVSPDVDGVDNFNLNDPGAFRGLSMRLKDDFPPSVQRRTFTHPSSSRDFIPYDPPEMPEGLSALRAHSVGNLDSISMVETELQQTSNANCQEEEQQQQRQQHRIQYLHAKAEEEARIREPIPFPSRQVFSFQERPPRFPSDRPPVAPKPAAVADMGDVSCQYQPKREEFGVTGEVVDSIFKSDHDSSSILQRPIPMEERQWSIPSLRMANQLDSSNTYGSLTCSDGEDFDDDGSLSSLGSSLYLPDEGILSFRPQPAMFETSVGQQPVLHMETGSRLRVDGIFKQVGDNTAASQPQHSSSSSPCSLVESNKDEQPHPELLTQKSFPVTTRTARPSKKRNRDRRAFEWLRSVEVERENDFLVEAASSKFLTGSVPSTARALSAGNSPTRPNQEGTRRQSSSQLKLG